MVPDEGDATRNGSLPKLDFSNEDQATIVAKVQDYFLTEFELDVGRFEAEGMLQFFAKEIGAHFYNRGLYDAQAVITGQIDAINDA
ncbi:MAG: DUF2164 domain-containing protein, partial [Rhizobium sp.]|nr:DUF2164 domain-containing protein [Rhizobium sp.]